MSTTTFSTPALSAWISLKLLLVIVGASALLVGVVNAVATSGAGGAAAQMAITIAWNGAFNAVAAVTIIFATLQRYSPRLRLLSDWRARDLPALRKVRRATWIDHLAGIVANVVFILWWNGALQRSPLIPLHADQRRATFHVRVTRTGLEE